MSDYPQQSGGQPPRNPLPYPDRHRPGQQSYVPSDTSPEPHGPPQGGLPYPDRPARYKPYEQQYSSYAQQSGPTDQYSEDSPTYRPPVSEVAPAKPNKLTVQPPPPQASISESWPTSPTPYNDPVSPAEKVKPGRTGAYGNTSTSSQSGHPSTGAFALSGVSAALPQTTSPPPQNPAKYSPQPIQHPGPPVPAKIPQDISPPPTNVAYNPPPPTVSTAALMATGAAIGTAAHNFPAPQSPVSPTVPSPPFQPTQSPTQPQSPAPVPSPSLANPQYAPPQATSRTNTGLGQPPPSPSGPVPPALQYLQSTGSAPAQTPPPGQYAPPPMSNVPPPPPVSPVPGVAAGVIQLTSPSPLSPAPNSPVSPAQQYLQPASPTLPTQAPPPTYVNTLPPIPGTATAPAAAAAVVTAASQFPPPPQTPIRPPTQPNQQPQTVTVDGKQMPIPPFTQTILSPSQIDPLLTQSYFGPYLRFKNVDLQRNLWMGSILLIHPSNLPPPIVEFHPSGDISQLQGTPPQIIYSYANYSFFRYDLSLPIVDTERKWTYAVTTQGTQTWEFLVASTSQQWRFLAWSCNDFSASVKEEERTKLGFSTLWKDVMNRYVREGGFHAQLGGGDQIYADRMWKEIPFLVEWLNVRGKEQRQFAPWRKEHEEIMRFTYFYYYTSSFAKPYLRDALARIPHVFQIDDHDIFDGFGSYPRHLQQSLVFQGIGKIALEMYLVFQHHTSHEYLKNHPDPTDLITATGNGWSFLKYFGPSTVILGLDTRAERDKRLIMSQQSYDLMFNTLRQCAPTVQHCVVMLAVPIVYPRLEVVEKALTGVQVAKRGINGAFNLLGKAVTSVTPSGQATQEADSVFSNVKKAFGKSGLMSSVVSKFGQVDLLDDLMDHWTHANHAHERTMVIRTLQEIAFQRKIRITMVSGDVHCCGVGYLYDPKSPQDHKLMYQIITSAIVNVPPPGMVIKLLHNKDQLWVPPINSSQSTKIQSDTKEEMMELFAKDVDGKDLGNLKKLLPRRNYAICKGGDNGAEVWELCVERGRGSETVKYGPIAIPRLL